MYLNACTVALVIRRQSSGGRGVAVTNLFRHCAREHADISMIKKYIIIYYQRYY